MTDGEPAPAPLGVGHVLIHVQLPPDVDVDEFAEDARRAVLRLDPRATVHTVRQPPRRPRD